MGERDHFWYKMPRFIKVRLCEVDVLEEEWEEKERVEWESLLVRCNSHCYKYFTIDGT